MGYENDMMPDISPIVVDLETVGLPNAGEFLEPVTAAKNLVDPAKIAEDIRKRTAERDEKLALDWNVGRIVALGWWTETRSQCSALPTEEQERDSIETFWKAARGRTIVTFNGRGFDLPFLMQRSRYLGIKHPSLDLRPYGGGSGNVDLYLELTFGRKETPCMRQTLKSFCRRFGIPVVDDINGKEIPALVAAGDWESVLLHLTSDVELTVALARRLGIVRPVPAAEQVA
jgi:DNA polymerase elongation subunit (family B)